jgi:hypothetical protein
MSTPVTSINVGYLTNLRTTLNELLDDVNLQIKGIGSFPDSDTTGDIAPVDGNLQVQAGLISSSAVNGFDAAGLLNSALASMGGSVATQLTWLQKVFEEMISEVGNTITAIGTNGELNDASISALDSDFQQTMNSLQQGPGGSSSGSGS